MIMSTNPPKKGFYNPSFCLTPYLLSEVEFLKKLRLSTQKLKLYFNRESLPQVQFLKKKKLYWEGYRFFLRRLRWE